MHSNLKHKPTELLKNLCTPLSLLVAIFASALCSSLFFSQLSRGSYSIVSSASHTVTHYDSKSSDSRYSAPALFQVPAHTSLSEISVTYSFRPYSLDGFPNIFQTAPVNNGLRVELGKDGTMVLLTNSSSGLRGFIIGDKINPDTWHYMRISAFPGQGISVELDGKPALNANDPALSWEISDITVGRGFNMERIFRGEITGFEISYKLLDKRHGLNKTTASALAYAFAGLSACLCFCLLFRLLPRFSFPYISSTGLPRQKIWYFVPLLVVLASVILHIYGSWHVQLSEDTGFYGYLSRKIAEGLQLHRDVLVSSNSIMFYIVALVFKIFGSSIDSFRAVHAVGYAALATVVTITLTRYLGIVEAIVGGLICCITVAVPSTTLDLGRHYIYFSMAFLFSGIGILCSESRWRYYAAGFCLGMAALVRETFLVVSLSYILLLIAAYCVRRIRKLPCAITPTRELIIAFAATLSINAIIVTCMSNWHGYLSDMLVSGTSFRYQNGIFSVERLKDNLRALSYGYSHFYAPVIICGLVSYLIRTDSAFINSIRYFWVPVLIAEALILNKTTEYSIIPLLVCASVLIAFMVSYLVHSWKDFFSGKWKQPWAVLLTAGFVAISVMARPHAMAIQRNYSDYWGLSRALHSLKGSYYNEHSNRILYVADRIPHSTIAAFAQFPTLFLSKYTTPNNAYIEDLSASANLGRKDIWEKQTNYIQKTPPDILVLKTSGMWFEANDPLVKDLGLANYELIADFSNPTLGYSRSYKDRVYLSKKILGSFKKIPESNPVFNKDKGVWTLINNTGAPCVVGIRDLTGKTMKGVCIKAGPSTICGQDEPILFTFHAENDELTISTQDKVEGKTGKHFVATLFNIPH